MTCHSRKKNTGVNQKISWTPFSCFSFRVHTVTTYWVTWIEESSLILFSNTCAFITARNQNVSSDFCLLQYLYSRLKPKTNGKLSADYRINVKHPLEWKLHKKKKDYLHVTQKGTLLTLCVASFLISSCSLFKIWRFGLFFLAYCCSSITLLSEFSCKKISCFTSRGLSLLLAYHCSHFTGCSLMWQAGKLTRQCDALIIADSKLQVTTVRGFYAERHLNGF